MRRVSALLGAVVLLAPSLATAQLGLRHQVDQHGNFILIGNTIGFDCATGAGIPAPVVGTVGACGLNRQDSAPDVYWRSESPGAGQAQADTSIAASAARSTAILSIPAGASINYARLYWAAENGTNAAGTTVTLDRPNGASSLITADSSTLRTNGGQFYYQSTADVTSFVQAAGPGAFRVGGIATRNAINLFDNTWFGAWELVVFYVLQSEPTRNIAIFDGADLVRNGSSSSGTISGFIVPTAGFDARLGVVAYEGDVTLTGDQFFFNSIVQSNALNPANNFFNGTRSLFGAAVSVAGDLPQLTGGTGSMTGVDMDVLDVTTAMTPGETTASFQATSTGDFYVLGVFATAISTLKPVFTDTTKTFVDLTRSGAILPGDTIQYTITTQNTGTDTAINVVLTDALPSSVAFVPGSIAISAGFNVGPKTDAAGDDQGEYDAATHTITVRLGAGANATQGGMITTSDPPQSVTFRVTVNAGATSVSNQAFISAQGAIGSSLGIPPEVFPSSDGSGSFSPPTTFGVDQCVTDMDCPLSQPHCNTGSHPFTCGPCSAADCHGNDPICSGTGACVPCNGDFGSGASAACPTASAPACEPSGACGQCSATDLNLCTGTTPTCNTTTFTCAACNGDNGSGSTRACPSPSDPACEPTGACGQCSATDHDLCVGTTPACDTTTDLCAACNGNNGSGASRQCPTAAEPACEPTGACGQCSASDQILCAGTTPICNTALGVCAGCNGDFGSGASRACPTGSAPACEPSGACGQCSATDHSLCTGNTPLCNTATGQCAGCNGDFGSGASRACPTAGVPACEPSGACGQCSATDQALCTGNTPICNIALGVCAACNGDFGSGQSRACPTAIAPACESSGACGQCSASDQALCTGNTPVCNTTLGVCAACNGDNGSGASRACPTAGAPACEPSGACGQCSAGDQALCTGNTPICNVALGVCAACNGNFGSGASRACPTASAPACEASGACAQCSATDQALCTGDTPICNTALGVCAACNGDFGSGASRACPSAVAPACEPTGACGQCSPTNHGLCTGNTPICSASGSCAACNGDFGSGATAACPSASAPACEASGACGQCSATNSTLCTGTTPACNIALGTCGACNGDFGSGQSRACPHAGAPACEGSGACGQCSATNASQCMGTTPICDTANNSCAACNGDFGSGHSLACPSAGSPACETSGACGQCSAGNSSQCTGTTPICNVPSGVCAGCNGDNGSGQSRACPSPMSPACEASGACGQCSASNSTECTGNTPVCNVTAGTCTTCNGDNGSGASKACPTMKSPACQPSGACTQCSAGNTTRCTGNTPVCGPTGQCVGCNGDFGSGASEPCPQPSPFCSTSGSCGRCASNTDCNGHPGGPVCDSTTGACTSGCAMDSDCASDHWCSAAHTCVPKAANGSPVPNIAPLNGQCTAGNGRRGCVSGVCDLADDICGTPNSRACQSAGECRSAVCDSDQKCGRPNGEPCTVASVCRTGVCDASDNLCGRINGEACTAGMECRSSACVSADGKCGVLNGVPCASGTDCRSGVCNNDGRCGDPNGSPCQGGASCRSGICHSSMCTGGGCADDTDCANGFFCAAAHQCEPVLSSGQPCTRPAECSSGTCGGDGLCGATSGSACAHPSDCRAGSACAGMPSTCRSACTSDAECADGSFCDLQSATCSPRAPSGSCTQASACQSGVCGPGGQCGVPGGFPCAKPIDCRAAICDPSGTCTSTCSADRDCSGGKFCDTAQKVCADVLVNSSTCARAAQCTSYRCDTDNKCGEPNAEACGSGLICRSSVCFVGDDQCGLPNGQPCTMPADCRSDVCASDGQCGSPNGTPCATGSECRSGQCDKVGICSACIDDKSCPGQWCDVAHGLCVPLEPNGVSCTASDQCQSGTCESDGLCGKIDGEPCMAPSECRSASCTAGLCGANALSPDAGVSGFGFAGGGCACSSERGVHGAIALFVLVLMGIGVRARGGRRGPR
jgi:uncharacterized repeat protein (TIGR01451 family)